MLARKTEPENHKAPPSPDRRIVERGRYSRSKRGVLLDLLVNATNSFTWEAETKCRRFTEVGPRSLKLLGYTTDQWCEPGFWKSHIHHDDLSRTMFLYERGIRQSPSFELTYRMITRDGRLLWVRDLIRVVSETRTVGVMTDFREDYNRELAHASPLGWIFDKVDEGVFIFAAAPDEPYRLEYANQAMKEIMGLAGEEIIGKQLEEVLAGPSHSLLLVKLRTLMNGNSNLGSKQRFTTGSVRCRFQFEIALMTGDDRGNNHLVGCVREITRAEPRVADGQKLVEALEEERKRIARELHDDLSQRMALLTIELGRLGQNLTGQEEARERLLRAVTRSQEISVGISRVSHELHSTQLDDVGLVNAINHLCEEFSGQTALNITFSCIDTPPLISKEASICLFRIAQEALRNIQKHSGADKATVTLIGTANELALHVEDNGSGFDLYSWERRPGMGLASMRERARMVRGTFTIHSKRSSGTQIVVRVPVPGQTGRDSPSSVLRCETRRN